MRKLIGPAMALLLFVSHSTSAVAPTQPQIIPAESFHSVILDFPSNPTVAPTRPQIVVPTPPIKILTLPTPPAIVISGVPSVAEAKSYALTRLGATQYSCIDNIFTRESHWRVKAYNSSSGAYGIPQALPGSKMAVIADDWRTNPITQVKWGIRYVNGRYGSACAAWRFHQNNGWY